MKQIEKLESNISDNESIMKIKNKINDLIDNYDEIIDIIQPKNSDCRTWKNLNQDDIPCNNCIQNNYSYYELIKKPAVDMEKLSEAVNEEYKNNEQQAWQPNEMQNGFVDEKSEADWQKDIEEAKKYIFDTYNRYKSAIEKMIKEIEWSDKAAEFNFQAIKDLDVVKEKLQQQLKEKDDEIDKLNKKRKIPEELIKNLKDIIKTCKDQNKFWTTGILKKLLKILEDK